MMSDSEARGALYLSYGQRVSQMFTSIAPYREGGGQAQI